MDVVHNSLFSPKGVDDIRVGAGSGRRAVVSKYHIGAGGASQPVSVIIIGVTC